MIATRSAISAVLAAASFACMGALAKTVTDQLPYYWGVFGRNLFGFICVLPLLFASSTSLKTNVFRYHLSRSVVGLAAMYCLFYALQNLPLAEAVLLNYTTPLFIPFVAYWWLRERVATPVKYAIVVGFLGVLLVLKPGLNLFSGAAVIGLLSGALAAGAMVNIRKLSATEPVIRIVFYFGLINTLISLMPVLTLSDHIWPTQSQWLALAAAGFFANLGQLLLTHAYTHAPAAQVGPYSYTAVPIAALIGWFFWREALDAFTILGAVLVVVAGAIAMRGR